MMTNLDNQRPGDLWVLGGDRLEVVDVVEPGVMRCRHRDGSPGLIVVTVTGGPPR